MIAFELDTIKKVGEYRKRKPSEYYHRCSGSNDFRDCAPAMLDLWSTAQIIQCCRAGRENWSTPRCKYCDGQHVVGEMTLRDSERHYNRGIDAFIAVLEDVK